MSLRMYCPGCDSETSTIRGAFMAGRDCPSCGLSASAAEEIMAVRNRLGDEKLKAELEAALKRVDQLEQDNQTMKSRLDRVQRALSEDVSSPFG